MPHFPFGITVLSMHFAKFENGNERIIFFFSGVLFELLSSIAGSV